MQTLFVGPEHAQPLSFIPAGEQPVADAHFTRAENTPMTKPGGGQPFKRLFYFSMKRLLDLTLTLFALGLIWPLLLLIAAAIKLDSPGPVFVTQERVGVRRRRNQNRLAWEQTRFRLYKFRTTMATDKRSQPATYNAAHHPPHSLGAPQQAITMERNADSSVTKVGRFLQQTCLEQLPQLWNILKGELTLVGPRPVLPAELQHYAPSALRRFETLPGMTGLWQLREPRPAQLYTQTKAARERQRGLNFEQMVQADLDYIENQSLGLDLQILGNTLVAVLRSQPPSV